jgi:very-short-patch-repair endonuclease
LDDEDNRLSDLESILGTMTGQRAPQRMLRWHYRSRHESLIAVSNQEFYDGNLVIFPNFNPADPTLGIKYHYLPDTVYERGATSSNPLEARAVAEAVFRHARECPELTLGVAAFSVKQMQAVYDEVERMRMEDNSCEEFFGAHEHEPFFVKNLENVQGDERDVIFISVGYGRDEDGKVSMNFGPLNSDGGERRLNVLITRARRRCEVFTNLRALDIDMNRTSARGVGVFRAYLQYAETGNLEAEANSAHTAISTLFEEEVADFLRQAGYQVQMKVGTAGFFIDLAVFNANQPGVYLLGIECDGPEYNRARTSRDRDRLRQQVLEGLGWQVYRLWSVEWFAHPEAEQARLLAAIEAAQRGEQFGQLAAPAEEADQLREKRLEELQSIRREATSAKLTGAISQPVYQKAKFKISTGKKDLIEMPEQKRVKWVTRIVQAESPVHQDVAYARYLELADRRTGSNNSRSFEEALLAAKTGQSPTVWASGEFLFDNAELRPEVRDRRRLKSEERKLEWVADEEIDASILMAVEQSYGIEAEDISIAATRLMGFDRTLEPMRVQIDARVTGLLAGGQLTKLEGQIQIPEGGTHGE